VVIKASYKNMGTKFTTKPLKYMDKN